MNQFQSFRFFYGMRIPHLSLLIKCATEVTYRTGEILFKAGDPMTSFFLIKTGALALHPEPGAKTRAVKTAHSGEAVGWSCLVPQATWHFSGQALRPTNVTILDSGRLLAAAQENPDFGRELLKRAAQFELERLENEGGIIKVDIDPLAAPLADNIPETVTGDSLYFSNGALDLSPWDAKQLCLHDGEWVQLTDRHGSAIVPVRIKSNKRQRKLPGKNGQSSASSPIDEQLNASYVMD